MDKSSIFIIVLMVITLLILISLLIGSIAAMAGVPISVCESYGYDNAGTKFARPFTGKIEVVCIKSISLDQLMKGE